jgi:hypothetical protein
MNKYKFKAKIEPSRGGGAYVVFPYDVEKEFGTRGQVPVQATFDGEAYQGSLAKYGFPQHILGVPKAIRETIGKGPGDVADVHVWKDEAERTVEIPPDLRQLMKKEGLLSFFGKTELHAAQGILPLDHRSKEGRDAAGTARKGCREIAGGGSYVPLHAGIQNLRRQTGCRWRGSC